MRHPVRMCAVAAASLAAGALIGYPIAHAADVTESITVHPATVGNPLATTIALQHLIFEGTLDRFPGLKVLAAHGGGYLGSYAARDDHACFVSPAGCDPTIKLKKQPSEYLQQLYFDSMVFTPEALRHLVAQVGASQVMLGSDYPYIWELHPVDPVFATPTLSDEERIGILGGNAAKLFGMEA